MSFSGRDNEFLQVTVTNDGFFPDLSLGELQKIYRIPTEAPQETIEHQMTVAMDTVNRELASFKTSWQALGATTMAEAEAMPEANGQKLVAVYKAAVYQWAKGELLEDFETFTRRDIADNIASQAERVQQAIKANARRAINHLLGKPASVSCEIL